ncbi:MCE family protein [Advenella sp. WQ 585]|uniref:MCE family protein n=1 Tax=Advenella mandrilli TaxID=2800330 RepID=A0ABS1EHI1_9BURK|nr:MlaD family protein [Advenella mandrilli]MBK1782456.1 MCE family protein [Advenella mandrilli]
MEPKAHHVLIGIFTVVCTAAALLFALWLGKSSADNNARYYIIEFNQGVSGLSKGSAVQYSGIKVGDVVSLSLDPNDPRKVLARVRVQSDVPIKQDVTAKLSITGITGLSVIEFSGGSPGSPELVGVDGNDPVILATPSALMALLSNSESLMYNLTELIVNAKNVLSDENAEKIGNTLDNIEDISNFLSAQETSVDGLLTEVTAMVKQVNGAMKFISDLASNGNELLSRQGAKVLESASQAMQSVENAGANIQQLVKNNQGAIGQGMQGLKGIGPALLEFRNAFSDLQGIIRQLKDNPSEYLLHGNQIKEFKP